MGNECPFVSEVNETEKEGTVRGEREREIEKSK
jgi:hypothetical protein